jgi:hypothetical protein
MECLATEASLKVHCSRQKPAVPILPWSDFQLLAACIAAALKASAEPVQNRLFESATRNVRFRNGSTATGSVLAGRFPV